jgi:anti-anti-sigma factor
MAVRLDQFNDVGVATPGGDLRGSETVSEFLKTLVDAIDAGKVAKLVVDFSAVRFIDSAGLEALLALRARLGDAISAIRLACLDLNCRKILELTRLDSRFEIHPDVPAAMKAVTR